MGMQLGNWQKDATPEQIANWKQSISRGLRKAFKQRARQAPASSIRTNGAGRFTNLNLAVLKLDKELAALRERREQLVKAQEIIDSTL